MKNYGFEVSLNGKKLCRAGFDTKYSVMTAILTWCRRKLDESEALDLQVGGLNSDDEKHYYWIEQPIAEGDEINVKIIDSGFGKGILREHSVEEDEKFILESKLKTYYKLKDELKEHLNE